MPFWVMAASRSMPFDVTAALFVVAWFTRATSFTATPAPMPTVPASVDLPLPTALASVFAEVFRLSRPVAVTCAESARDAR